ncbi:MAG: hypothetical protein GX790_01815 [Syntrophomonadaceae bacterium]|nr:hypothetical protein [Syntrophomonadaceae bacterium]
MQLRRCQYTAIITLVFFMIGLSLPSLKPAFANYYGVDITFSELNDKVLSGEVEFNIHTKVASDSDIQDNWTLRYKMEITDLASNTQNVGQVVYYGQNLDSSFSINIAGTIFKPEDNFTLDQLKANGIKTNFKTNFNEGDYVITISLIRVDDKNQEIELLGQKSKIITISDVIYTFLTPDFNQELMPGEITFTINSRVAESVSDTVYLRHKVTLWRNNFPLGEHKIQYKENNAWLDFTTNEDGVAYFGPEEGFKLEDLPELKSVNGITSEFKSLLTIGEYRIKLELIALDEEGEIIVGKSTERSFSVQRYPELISKFPDSDITGLTNDDLFPQEIDGVMRYFIKLTYKLDGDLRLTDNAFNLLRSSTVYSSGGSIANLIDTDFLSKAEETDGYVSKYIFVKEGDVAHLYIPVKPLRPQTNYQVRINPNIIYYFGGNNFDGSGNKAESWSFGTMAVPTVTGLSIGSVGEDYDVSEPIIITGDYFDSDNITVRFNDTYAYRVNVHNSDTGSYLEVYLPRGRDRLEPGVYDVTILKNNHENYSQTLYSSFSVVKASSLPVPQDGIRVKTDSRLGDVVQSVKTSSDTLLLKSSSSRQGYLYLDLDKLMGENVLVRKIEFPNNWRNITSLSTTSKWVNATLYNLRLDSSLYGTDDYELRLGRVDPNLIPTLKRGMINTAVKSEFIEIGAEGLTFDKIEVEIPYVNSDGQRIRVLRYDETFRQWYEQPFTKDLLNSRVHFSATQGGIFVVVE